VLKTEPRHHDFDALRDTRMPLIDRATLFRLSESGVAFNRFLGRQSDERFGQVVAPVACDRSLDVPGWLAATSHGRSNPRRTRISTSTLNFHRRGRPAIGRAARGGKPELDDTLGGAFCASSAAVSRCSMRTAWAASSHETKVATVAGRSAWEGSGRSKQTKAAAVRQRDGLPRDRFAAN
jgi:hypothetical protein